MPPLFQVAISGGPGTTPPSLPPGAVEYPVNPTNAGTTFCIYGLVPLAGLWTPSAPAPPDTDYCLEINANSATTRNGRLIFKSGQNGVPVLPASPALRFTTFFGPALTTRGILGRGKQLDTATPTYYGLNLIKPMTLALVAQLNGGAIRTLATLTTHDFLGQNNGTNFDCYLWIGDNPNTGNPSLRAAVRRFDLPTSASAALNGYWYVLDPVRGDGVWQSAFNYTFAVEDSDPAKITPALGGLDFALDKAAGAQDAAYFSGVSIDPNTLNAVPPTATVTSPIAGATLTGPISVTASYTAGPGITITNAVLLVDGVVVGAPLSPGLQTGTLTFPYDSRFMKDGAHTLAVRVTDSSLLVSTSAAVSVTASNGIVVPRWNYERKPSWAPVILLCYGSFNETDGSNFDQASQQILAQISGIVGAANAATIRQYSGFQGPIFVYTNIGNIYLQFLPHWFRYAEQNGRNVENAFYHQVQPTLSPGTAGGSTVPARNFWACYTVIGGTLAQQTIGYGFSNVGPLALKGKPNGAAFGGSVGDAMYLGYLDPFEIVTLTYKTAGSGGWATTLEFPTHFDANEVADIWAPATILSTTTDAYGATTIRFDAKAALAAGWKRGYPVNNPSTGKAAGYADATHHAEGNWLFYPGLRHYYVRLRTSTAGVPAVASRVCTADYANELCGAPVTPAWDPKADVDGDGFLSDAERPNRARFPSILVGGLFLAVPEAVYSQTGDAGIATLELRNDGPNQVLSASVTGTKCTVMLATDGYGNSITTDPQLVPAINAAASPALFTAVLNNGTKGSVNAKPLDKDGFFTVGKLKFAAATPGRPVIVTYKTTGANVSTITAVVTSDAIVDRIDVSLKTDGTGASTSTDAQIMTALKANADVNALVTITNPDASNATQGPLAASSWALEPAMSATNGADAWFESQGRMPGQYGTERYSVYFGPGVIDWFVEYHVTQLTPGHPNAIPNCDLVDGYFVDNSGVVVSTPQFLLPYPVAESTANYANEYGACVALVAQQINAQLPPTGRGNRVCMMNVGGDGDARPILSWNPCGFYEFQTRAGQHNTKNVTDSLAQLALDATAASPPVDQINDTYTFSVSSGPPIYDHLMQFACYCYHLLGAGPNSFVSFSGGQRTGGPWSASPGPLYLGNLRFDLAAGANSVYPGGVVAVTFKLPSVATPTESVDVITNVGPSASLQRAGCWNVVVTLAMDGTGKSISTDASILSAINGSVAALNLITPTLVSPSQLQGPATTAGYNWTGAAAPINLGVPSGTYEVLPASVGSPATGTDGNPGFSNYTWTCLYRAFVDGAGQVSAIVLYRPLSQSNTNPANAGPINDAFPATLTLTGQWYRLSPEGVVNPTQTNTVALGNGQGAILLKDPHGAVFSGGGGPTPGIIFPPGGIFGGGIFGGSIIVSEGEEG